MSVLDYERLLRELHAARQVDNGPDDELEELSTEMANCEQRLLQQQADLLRTASTLRIRAPRLRPADDEPPSDPDGDTARALRHVTQHADFCDAATSRAFDAAHRPSFLPHQRRIVRHLAVYGWCALGVVVLESLLVANQGFAAAAWVFAVAPLLACVVGFGVIGHVGRPRIQPGGRKARRDSLPTRHPKHGLMLLLVVSAATAVWWLLV